MAADMRSSDRQLVRWLAHVHVALLLRTCIGSSRAARISGSNDGTTDTASTRTTTPPRVIGSETDTPYSIPDSDRANAIASAGRARPPSSDTRSP